MRRKLKILILMEHEHAPDEVLSERHCTTEAMDYGECAKMVRAAAERAREALAAPDKPPEHRHD